MKIDENPIISDLLVIGLSIVATILATGGAICGYSGICEARLSLVASGLTAWLVSFAIFYMVFHVSPLSPYDPFSRRKS
jgi:hypothetical protein